jgi:hypothetical protein
MTSSITNSLTARPGLLRSNVAETSTNGGPGQSRLTRVMVVSYHYGDTDAVGAKRVNALTRFLADQGVEVDVIFAGDAAPAISGSTRIRHLPVADPPARFIPALLWIKRRFLPWVGNKKPVGARPEPELVRSAETPARATFIGSLKKFAIRAVQEVVHQILVIVYLFDGRKRWGIRVVRTALPLTRTRPYDWIITSSPPPISAIAAAWIARGSGVPLCIDLRDPWNSNSTVKTRARLPLFIDRTVQRWCLGRARLVTCASPGVLRIMTRRLPAVSTRAHVVLNGFDPADRIAAPVPSGRLELLYAGILYDWRNPFPLLESIVRLISAGAVEAGRIHISFVGDCEVCQGVRLADWALQRGISAQMSIYPRVPPAQITRFTEQANVLVSFARGQPDQIPAKTYQMLVAGRDLLVITEPTSDTAEIIRAANIGHCIDDKDPGAVDAAMLSLYRKHVMGAGQDDAVPASMQQFDRTHQNARWFAMLCDPDEGQGHSGSSP